MASYPSPPARNRIPRPATAARRSGSGEPREMTSEDAVDFLLRVQRAFSPAKCREFYILLLRIDSMGARAVFNRIKVMLHGHPDLKRRLNIFLPERYKLSLTDDAFQLGEAGQPIPID